MCHGEPSTIRYTQRCTASVSEHQQTFYPAGVDGNVKAGMLSHCSHLQGRVEVCEREKI